ncbi:MAG: cytochrome c [Holophagaceae bacterium]|uniref:Cytochrome c n=1 Tax=Candidatus Geothrix skivensis TaxID=2954439 RepID=A0A9D7SH90_9BACT|nr:cytochrome c [Candidatus Geothrix skivensis]
MLPRGCLLCLLFLVLPARAEVRDLKAFYQERCAVCHGPDGTGRGPNGIRLGGQNLLEARWLARQEEGDLVASILRGRGAMPGFRRQLSEPEARRLLNTLLQPVAPGKKQPGPLRTQEPGP